MSKKIPISIAKRRIHTLSSLGRLTKTVGSVEGCWKSKDRSQAHASVRQCHLKGISGRRRRAIGRFAIADTRFAPNSRRGSRALRDRKCERPRIQVPKLFADASALERQVV